MNDIAEKAHAMAVEAKQEVAKVNQKVESHDDLCAVRYENIKDTMSEIKEDRKQQDDKLDKHLDKIYGKQWAALIWLVGILVAALSATIIYIFTQTDTRLHNVENQQVLFEEVPSYMLLHCRDMCAGVLKHDEFRYSASAISEYRII